METDSTTWKTIPIFDGNYEVSNTGLVRSKDKYVTKYSILVGRVVNQFYKGKMLSLIRNRDGYDYVRIGHKKKKYSIQVGRLVLLAFVGNCQNGFECCHNNGVPNDNRLENLRWDSHFNNNQDRVKQGTYARGKNHHFSKFDEDTVLGIKNGLITKQEAFKKGVSNTHFYRLRNNKLCKSERVKFDSDVTIHAGKKAFEVQFGTERELLEEVYDLLGLVLPENAT